MLTFMHLQMKYYKGASFARVNFEFAGFFFTPIMFCFTQYHYSRPNQDPFTQFSSQNYCLLEVRCRPELSRVQNRTRLKKMYIVIQQATGGLVYEENLVIFQMRWEVRGIIARENKCRLSKMWHFFFEDVRAKTFYRS